jgi:ATP-binding cassette, subfamily C (CFTR/MRP), member 1
MVLSSLSDMLVAVNRISSFLTAEEQPDPYLIDDQAKNAIVVDGDFAWDAVKESRVADKEKREEDKAEGTDANKKDKTRKKKKGNPEESVLPVTAPETTQNDQEQVASVESEEAFTMKNLKFTVPKNAFVAIVGRVGSGKVSL